MENVTRTVYGAYMQTCAYTRTQFRLIKNTTLNEKLNIQADAQLDANVMPAMRYFAIGIGGVKFSVGASGNQKLEPVQFDPSKASLYKQIPFILRPIDNDIDIATRQQYALRRIETHNGDRFIAYYLRRIDLSNSTVGLEYTKITDGVETVTEFVPDASALNPTPPTLSSTGVNYTSGDTVSASLKMELTFSSDEIQEIRDACNIIYSDDSYANISEIALVSGVDKIISAPTANDGAITFTEVIAAQITAFARTMISCQFSADGATTSLDIGSCEPILKLS